jgi:hypothetical protein
VEEPALTIGLDINVEKTKYINTSRSRQQDTHTHTRTLDINGKVYQEVTDFKYLGSNITSDNNCERDTKARMAAGNRCCYALT